VVVVMIMIFAKKVRIFISKGTRLETVFFRTRVQILILTLPYGQIYTCRFSLN